MDAATKEVSEAEAETWMIAEVGLRGQRCSRCNVLLHIHVGQAWSGDGSGFYTLRWQEERRVERKMVVIQHQKHILKLEPHTFRACTRALKERADVVAASSQS